MVHLHDFVNLIQVLTPLLLGYLTYALNDKKEDRNYLKDENDRLSEEIKRKDKEIKKLNKEIEELKK